MKKEFQNYATMEVAKGKEVILSAAEGCVYEELRSRVLANKNFFDVDCETAEALPGKLVYGALILNPYIKEESIEGICKFVEDSKDCAIISMDNGIQDKFIAACYNDIVVSRENFDKQLRTIPFAAFMQIHKDYKLNGENVLTFFHPIGDKNVFEAMINRDFLYAIKYEDKGQNITLENWKDNISESMMLKCRKDVWTVCVDEKENAKE